MPKRILSGGVVINPQGQVVVVNQNGNSWSLPKGQIEAGESEVEAAKREIYEESGIKPENLELIKKLGEYERFRIGKDGIIDEQGELRIRKIYLFKTSQEQLKPIDPENPEAKWVKIAKVSQLLTHPKDKEFFESVKDLLIC